MGTRRNYTREFKVEAVRLLNTSGKSGHEIEQDLGIGTGVVYRWRKQLEQEEGGSGLRAFPGKGTPRDEELARLRREVTVLREEREILRKALAIFSRPKK